MWKNYMTVAVRNLLRQKGYSAINIAGLAAGMVCAVLIMLWVQEELSYDRFHENAEWLYRVEADLSDAGGIYHTNVTPFPAGPAFAAEVPEILAAARCTWTGLLFRYGEKVFFEEEILAVDRSFFSMFTFPFIGGEAETALDDPHSLVLTRSMAEKYFGDAEPVGKVITVNNRLEFRVTGLVEDSPVNSTLDFEIAIPFEVMREVGWWYESWERYSITTFVQLREDVSAVAVEAKMTALVEGKIEESTSEFRLMPFTDIHLHSYSGYGHPMGDIQYLYIFSGVALFVLLIACINFMNLSTARSARRAREIGLRKVVGALRGHMVRQFLGESIFLAAIALLVSLPVLELLLPSFNELIGRELEFDLMGNWPLVLGLVIIVLCTGLVAGSYPALFLSSFRPAVALKGNLRSGAGGALFRKLLVVVQFTLSIGLIIATGVVYDQLTFMRDKKLGYDEEQLLYIEMRGDISRSYDALKNALGHHPALKGMTASTHKPSYMMSSSDGSDWDGKDPELSVMTSHNWVSFDFVETLGIELVEGRSFSQEHATDAEEAYLVNEEMVELMGVESAVGERFSLFEKEGKIVGVMRDFHFAPIGERIEPLALMIKPPTELRYILVKLRAESAIAGVDFLKETWAAVVPDYPLEYEFLDRDFERMYRGQERMGKGLGYFSLAAVLIGCLGLFGLASFMAEQRTREIGVRKVLGASVAGLVLLLTREFTRLVVVANLIAWPLAWLAMDGWLENFAYRTDLSWSSFALAGGAALGIAWLTVGWQAVRAALINPVEALRYE
jgi:putative ABC transport system permease protein